MDYYKEALKVHAKHHGKVEIKSKVSVQNREELSVAYTPGVAEPCKEIHKNPSAAYTYTCKANMVAVVTNGTAVLGLGNIGATAALPVMEGKSILFKDFGGVDAFPICLDTQDTEKIIETVKLIAPTFGGINLEDIASPACFEIEKRLEQELDIPAFHDDQHGTAIVVTAALLNALKLVHKTPNKLKVVLNGPGAAGTAIIHMLRNIGVTNIIACDEFGILYPNRPAGLQDHKKGLAEITNPQKITGALQDAIQNADVFIGVSVAGALTFEMAQSMAPNAIVFAMANPVPEISYELAKRAGVAIMATGRSDTPNQVNNVLAFPGIFKGALSVRARDINSQMKVAAANAIANTVTKQELTPEYIIPSAFNKNVAENVANAVAEAAVKTGVAQI